MNRWGGPMTSWIVLRSLVLLLALGCENSERTSSGERDMGSKVVPSEERLESSRQLFTKDDEEVFARAQEARNSLCPSLCGLSVEAGCAMAQDECLKHCMALTEKIVCPEQNAAYIACAISKSFTDFECSPAGFAILKGHLCLREKAAMIDCAQAAMAR